MTDQTTEPDEALVEAVATTIDDYRGLDDVARAAIAAVRAWDAENPRPERTLRVPIVIQAPSCPGTRSTTCRLALGHDGDCR